MAANKIYWLRGWNYMSNAELVQSHSGVATITKFGNMKIVVLKLI